MGSFEAVVLHKDNLRQATATHEAGHAVVGSSLGLPVESLSIIGDDGKGHTGMGDPSHLGTEDRAATWLAGTVAQELLQTVRWRQDGWYDEGQVAVLVRDLQEDEQVRIWKVGRARAQEVLNEHFAQLVRVADQLAASGHITSEQFEKLMAQS